MAVGRSILWLALAACLGGCAAESSSAPDSSTPPPDMQADEGGGPATGALAVKVLQIDGAYLPSLACYQAADDMGWFGDLKTLQPAAGATIVADLPGGQRVEATAGADGRVTFDGVLWSAGTAALTAYREGHRVHTIAGISEADGEQTLYLHRAKPPAVITVSGMARNLPPGAASMGVGGSTYGNSYEGSAPAYQLAVQRDEPFTLVAFAANVFTSVSHPGAPEDVTEDLDFSKPLAPQRVTATISLPATGAPAPPAGPRFWVRQWGSSLILGITAKRAEQSTGVWSVAGIYVEPPNPEGVYTSYIVEAGTNWHASFIVVAGPPAEGAKVEGFLPLPELIQPQDLATPMEWTAPIEWSAPEPQVVPVLYLVDNTTGETRWAVEGRPGMTRLTLPALPANAAGTSVLGAAPLTARLRFCADKDATTRRCGRFSNSPVFAVQPPR